MGEYDDDYFDLGEYATHIHVNFDQGSFSVLNSATREVLDGTGNYTMVYKEGFIAFTKKMVFNANFRYKNMEFENYKTLY